MAKCKERTGTGFGFYNRRVSLHLSLAEASKLLGMSSGHLSAIERSSTETEKQMKKLTDAYDKLEQQLSQQKSEQVTDICQ